MQLKNDFIELIDSKFFLHVINKSLMPFEFAVKPQRKQYLSDLYDNLIRQFTNYIPQTPRKYITTPKSKYAIRMVPTFELGDYCIYYFCVKVLEEYIAENRTTYTYGGYSLGGKIRQLEESDFEPGIEDSYNPDAFNAFAWKREFGAFQTAIKTFAEQLRRGDFKKVIRFDIANFYDNVRFDILERDLRDRVNSNQFDDEIHLLFRFLRNWNRQYVKDATSGLPQDEVGPCSRLLSNFYLQKYDQYLASMCKQKNAQYLRFADDQLIFTQSNYDMEYLIYLASEKLFEVGLNINCAKIKTYGSYQELDDYYSLSTFEKLTDSAPDLDQAVSEYLNKIEKRIEFRDFSLLKRILKFDLKGIKDSNRMALLSKMLGDDFLLSAPDHYLRRIYNSLLNDSEKNNFLHNARQLAGRTQFESYKLHFQRFEKSLNLNVVGVK